MTTEKINFITIIEREEPIYVNCFIIDFSYNYDKSCVFQTISIKSKKNAIIFVNYFNEHYKTLGLVNTISDINNLIEDEPDIELLYNNFKNSKNDYQKIEKARISSYYNKYGKASKILINKTFSPFASMEVYSNHALFSNEYSDELLNYISKFDYFLIRNDEYLDHSIFRNNKYNHSCLFDEDEQYYYFRVDPNRLEREGCLLQFKKEYNYNDSILIKVNKETLELYSEEEPVFNSLKVKNKAYKSY